LTTTTEAAKRVNRGYVDVFLKRRLPSGEYEADWMDVSLHIDSGSISALDFSLDSGDFDVGLFRTGNLSMVFINRTGKFSDVRDSRSLWAAFETRHLSKIKIEAGYRDDDDERIVEVVFNGLWDDRTVAQDSSDNVNVTILALESVFQTVNVIPGSLSSALAASEVIYALCARSEITTHFTVDLANIDPANDITIDVPSAFAGRPLDSVLQEIMLLTNSVMYVDADGDMIVRNRETLRRVVLELRLNSETGKSDNIFGLSAFNTGRQRVKNYWSWSSTVLVAQSEDHHQRRFGVATRSVSSSAITDNDVRQDILDALLAEWQFPKRELEVVTDYLPNAISFFDLVTVDVRPSLARHDDLPMTGEAVAGTDRVVGFASGLTIEKEIGFKVLAIKHDLRAFTTTLKLREKGNQLNDGYISTMISKAVTVEFTAEATKDIDVSVYGMDAQYCKVEPTDEDSDFETLDITVSRPSTSIIRLTAGGNITATMRILIAEVEA
jgi:hypothetical protein